MSAKATARDVLAHTVSHGDLNAGDRVKHRDATKGFGLVDGVGVILHFIEPAPDWHRALVRWDGVDADDSYAGCEQYVDVDRLAKVGGADMASAPAKAPRANTKQERAKQLALRLEAA